MNVSFLNASSNNLEMEREYIHPQKFRWLLYEGRFKYTIVLKMALSNVVQH